MSENEDSKPKKGRKRENDYEWKTVEVGSYFTTGEEYTREHMQRISVQCNYYSDTLKKKFSCRKADKLTHLPSKPPFYELQVWRDA